MSQASSIAHYIKDIGRGKMGAGSLTRVQAADLFGLVLDGEVSDLEIGAFCLSMRMKGETPEELLGFMDAAQARLRLDALPARWRLTPNRPVAVIPSYNGARRLPLLTPLLALLLERKGLSVLLHGLDEGVKTALGVERVTSADIFNHLVLDAHASANIDYVSIAKLSPPLKKLLDVRKTVGLRNSAHSVVKLINPYRAVTKVRSVLVTSYTHPEYAISMSKVLSGLGANALLIRGTEGEAVADPRRSPLMSGFRAGTSVLLEPTQQGSMTPLLVLPKTSEVAATARYIESVLSGEHSVPAPIALQVQHILSLV